MHEIAVTATFISEHGAAMAQRYSDYEAIESYRILGNYDRHHQKLGYEPFSDAERQEVVAAFEAMKTKYGKTFAEPNGWAAEALGKERPTFAQIEAATKFEHWRSHYQMASHPTHAGPKAISFSLALLPEEDLLLLGPSNLGLSDPGHSAAISLLQTTAIVLSVEPTLDGLITLRCMGTLVDEIGAAFLEADKAVKLAHRSHREREPGSSNEVM